MTTRTIVCLTGNCAILVIVPLGRALKLFIKIGKYYQSPHSLSVIRTTELPANINKTPQSQSHVLSDSLRERRYGIDLHVCLAVDKFLHGSNLG